MNVEEVVKLAMDYVGNLFTSGGAHDLRLEEVAALDNGSWDVTVSFRERGSNQNIAMFGKAEMIDVCGQKAAIGVDPYRVYKQVAIDSDGQIKSVQMRPIVVG